LAYCAGPHLFGPLRCHDLFTLGATPLDAQGMVVKRLTVYGVLAGRGADSRNRQFNLRSTDLQSHNARNRDSIALRVLSVRCLCTTGGQGAKSTKSRRLGLRLNERRCVNSSQAAFASESSKISEFGKPSIRAKWGHHDALKDHQLEASKCSGEADGGERKLTEGALHAQPRVAS